jgi:hypothetical protein
MGLVTLSANQGRQTLAGTGSNGDLPFAKELFEAADRMRGSGRRPGRSRW